MSIGHCPRSEPKVWSPRFGERLTEIAGELLKELYHLVASICLDHGLV